tara:strand:- start:1419 stop:2285 length:867 start_codon:yes stop_codon:yes gene_type:complete
MSEEDKKIDYLEVDEQIPGQNYVCMSFLSPETLIQNREAFNTAKFLQSYCKDQKLKFEEVYEKYKDFTYKHEDQLQRDFDEQNDFQTSLRGIKVRGVFDTRGAAEAQAKKLSTRDSSFHVFIGQVGYWLPWEPNADKVADEVFQNSQLNDMMEKYQENNINRDMFYEEQKRDKIKAAQEEVRKNKEEQKKKEQGEQEEQEEQEAKKIEDFELEPEPETENDPEPEVESSPEPAPEPAPEPEVESSPEPELVDVGGPTSENKLDKDMTDSLEADDPWMQQKLSQDNPKQ